MDAEEHRHDPEPGQEDDRATREDHRELYEVGRNIEWLCEPTFTREFAQNVVKETQCTS